MSDITKEPTAPEPVELTVSEPVELTEAELDAVAAGSGPSDLGPCFVVIGTGGPTGFQGPALHNPNC